MKTTTPTLLTRALRRASLVLLALCALATAPLGFAEISGAANGNGAGNTGTSSGIGGNGEEQAKAIPFDQLGAEAQKQYSGDGIGITPTAGGARLRAIMQRIEGEATAEGLWLSSTAEEDAGLVNRFRVRAVEMGRMGGMSPIGLTGVVQATKETLNKEAIV